MTTNALSLLARNIETRKTQLGITTSIELARKSGVSRAVLTNIKKNPDKSIMLDSAVQLSEALECRLEWLATGKGSPTSDEYLEVERVSAGAPVIKLNELKNKDINEFLMGIKEDKFRQRFLCPFGNSASQFIILLNSNIQKYAAGGYLYFDTAKQPISGDLVVVKQGDNVDMLEYQAALGKEYIKSLNESIPEDLRICEITDQELLATVSAYTVF